MGTTADVKQEEVKEKVAVPKQNETAVAETQEEVAALEGGAENATVWRMLPRMRMRRYCGDGGG